jgi:hypothetical protein
MSSKPPEYAFTDCIYESLLHIRCFAKERAISLYAESQLTVTALSEPFTRFVRLCVSSGVVAPYINGTNNLDCESPIPTNLILSVIHS